VAVPYVDGLLARVASGEAQVILAEDAGVIVGFVGVIPRHPSDDLIESHREFAYISDLFVRAERQRQGIGSRLLREAERWAAEAGAVQMRIGVLAGNAAAHALYRQLGYRDYEIVLERPILRGE
jgi:GNAT superfamily N-acetyltransferase